MAYSGDWDHQIGPRFRLNLKINKEFRKEIMLGLGFCGVSDLKKSTDNT